MKVKFNIIVRLTGVSFLEEENEMIRTIRTEEIVRSIREMCIEANHYLSPDMEQALNKAKDTEQSPLGKTVLSQLQ